jgi:flagellin-like hook-associated protein FlgL
MDNRLRSMEGKLHHVKMIEAKVTALDKSTGDLGAQQGTLSSAVERIDLAQMQLTTNVDRNTTAPCNPPHD